ncbi:hypothetical protein SLEP1_g10112 [Rubroshorea leprosula]|uniref:Uncharacterized protein n=1 Tax=Rubroshorea leprosula TaxID=152421 RepID=A0AAV5IGI1_9ROSI|nr:hypothetical protein SLEP1_g10112 [Rubroshorea leprosula]
MMLINALKDLNSLPASESKNDDSSRGCFTKPCNGNMNENVEEKQREKSSPIHVNGGETVNSGVEVANSEIEFIEYENLSDLEDIDTSLKKSLNLSQGINVLFTKCSATGVEGIKTYGIDRLIQVAASQHIDQHPESREACSNLSSGVSNCIQEILLSLVSNSTQASRVGLLEALSSI